MRIITKCLLLAAVLLGAVGPGAAIAGKKEKTAFRITITIEAACTNWYEWGLGGCSEWSGKFHVTGAIADRGSAWAAPLLYEFRLDGRAGSITFALAEDRSSFTIVEGTGAYAGLAGGGSVSLDLTLLGDLDDPDHVRADFDLRGTVAGA